jgi:hypothetical protein
MMLKKVRNNRPHMISNGGVPLNKAKANANKSTSGLYIVGDHIVNTNALNYSTGQAKQSISFAGDKKIV